MHTSFLVTDILHLTSILNNHHHHHAATPYVAADESSSNKGRNLLMSAVSNDTDYKERGSSVGTADSDVERSGA